MTIDEREQFAMMRLAMDDNFKIFVGIMKKELGNLREQSDYEMDENMIRISMGRRQQLVSLIDLCNRAESKFQRDEDTAAQSVRPVR